MTLGKDRNPQGHRSEGHLGELKAVKWDINRVLSLAGLSNVIEVTPVS